MRAGARLGFIVEALGALLIVVGLALWSIPVALVVAGLIAIVAAQVIPVEAKPDAEESS